MVCGPRTSIIVKRMGELDAKVFKAVLDKRFPHERNDVKALELCSLWQNNVTKSEWHPFKIITVEGELKV